MGTKTKKTLRDLKKISSLGNIGYIITRYWSKESEDPDDLDIYVEEKDFKKFVKGLESLGYKAFSHDSALGGRVKGAQINLVKENRIKIDLHKDFTWRKNRYLDLNFLYEKGSRAMDAFLVMINIIFEKTYITEEEYELFYKNKKQIFIDKDFFFQSKKYKWDRSYFLFQKWVENKKLLKKDLPVFVPFYIILFSYLEDIFRKHKFHLVSFLYYFFFRTRYLFNKKLPYD